MYTTDLSTRLMSEARDAIQVQAVNNKSEQIQLTERLLSHFEAGPSTAESQDPLLQSLRAQKLALSLLHRGVRLPTSLLDAVGQHGALQQVRTDLSTLDRPAPCTICDHRLCVL